MDVVLLPAPSSLLGLRIAAAIVWTRNGNRPPNGFIFGNCCLLQGFGFGACTKLRPRHEKEPICLPFYFIFIFILGLKLLLRRHPGGGSDIWRNCDCGSHPPTDPVGASWGMRTYAVLVTLPAIRQQWENFNEYKLLPNGGKLK